MFWDERVGGRGTVLHNISAAGGSKGDLNVMGETAGLLCSHPPGVIEQGLFGIPG